MFDYFHLDDMEGAVSHPAPYHDRFRNHVQLAQTVDQAGFDYYFVAEHHLDGKFAQCPSPGVFLGAAAAVTKQIRLGPMGYVVPLWNPVRLAEEIIMLDLVMNGRLELGLVSGINKEAFDLYGVNFERKNELFWSGFDTLIEVLHKPHAFQHSFPLPPTIWHPSRDKASLRESAIHGWSTAQWVQPRVEEVKRIFDEYREIHKGNYNYWDSKVPPQFGLLREIYVSFTDSAARMYGEPYWKRFWNRFHRHPLPENIGNVTREQRRNELLDLGHSIGDNSFICGSPATVVEQIKEVMEATTADVFLGDFTFGMDYSMVNKSVNLFVTEVMPKLK